MPGRRCSRRDCRQRHSCYHSQPSDCGCVNGFDCDCGCRRGHVCASGCAHDSIPARARGCFHANHLHVRVRAHDRDDHCPWCSVAHWYRQVIPARCARATVEARRSCCWLMPCAASAAGFAHAERPGLSRFRAGRSSTSWHLFQVCTGTGHRRGPFESAWSACSMRTTRGIKVVVLMLPCQMQGLPPHQIRNWAYLLSSPFP